MWMVWYHWNKRRTLPNKMMILTVKMVMRNNKSNSRLRVFPSIVVRCPRAETANCCTSCSHRLNAATIHRAAITWYHFPAAIYLVPYIGWLRCHMLSYAIRHCHMLSYAIRRCHMLSYTIRRYQMPIKCYQAAIIRRGT